MWLVEWDWDGAPDGQCYFICKRRPIGRVDNQGYGYKNMQEAKRDAQYSVDEGTSVGFGIYDFLGKLTWQYGFAETNIEM